MASHYDVLEKKIFWKQNKKRSEIFNWGPPAKSAK